MDTISPRSPWPARQDATPGLFILIAKNEKTDETRDGVLFHVLAHVDADHGLLIVEEKFGEGAGCFSFANTGGAKKDEAADRALGIAQAGAGTANCIGNYGQSGILAHDALAQALLHMDRVFSLRLPTCGRRGCRSTC